MILDTQPDLTQCQGFILIADTVVKEVRRNVRCSSAPTVIAFTNLPDWLGHYGRAALCDACRAALVRHVGPDYCTICKIKELPACA